MRGGYLVDNENDSVERAFSVPSPALQDFHVHNSAMDRKVTPPLSEGVHSYQVKRFRIGIRWDEPRLTYRTALCLATPVGGVPVAFQLRTLLTDLASRNGHLRLPELPPLHHEYGLSGLGLHISILIRGRTSSKKLRIVIFPICNSVVCGCRINVAFNLHDPPLIQANRPPISQLLSSPTQEDSPCGVQTQLPRDCTLDYGDEAFHCC